MTDACGNGIDGVVAQGLDWKNTKVATFYSAKMTSTQQNYPVHEQEMLVGVETMLWHQDVTKAYTRGYYTSMLCPQPCNTHS